MSAERPASARPAAGSRARRSSRGGRKHPAAHSRHAADSTSCQVCPAGTGPPYGASTPSISTAINERIPGDYLLTHRENP